MSGIHMLDHGALQWSDPPRQVRPVQRRAHRLYKPAGDYWVDHALLQGKKSR